MVNRFERRLKNTESTAAGPFKPLSDFREEQSGHNSSVTTFFPRQFEFNETRLGLVKDVVETQRVIAGRFARE